MDITVLISLNCCLMVLTTSEFELGVAAGEYSSKMAGSGKFSTFWGVDMYADTHDTAQYKQALLNVGIDKNYKLLRMTFDEALDLSQIITLISCIWMDMQETGSRRANSPKMGKQGKGRRHYSWR